jgi:hypothetical protein
VFGRAFAETRGHRFLVLLLIAGIGIALYALQEVAECGFERSAPGDVIKGKHDTVVDILMDTAGAVLAGSLALKLTRPPR